MKESDYSYELIAKELTSDNGTNESEELQQIFAADKKLKKKFRVTENFWMNYFPAQKSHSTIEKTEKKLDFTYQNNPQIKSSLIYKIAAVFFFILSIGLATWFYMQPKNDLTLKEYTCGAGEIKKVVLSDGTEVWLNNMSVLVTVEPFESDNRRVKLIGEAYFDVTHNAEKPFVVETFGLRTEVLGTSFNLNAYPRLKHKEIALYEGSVKISADENPGKSLLINPGEKVRVSDNNSKFYISEIDSKKPAVWRAGILEFRNEEFFEIARKLERKFNTRIFIASQKTGELRFTAEFENEPLEKILKLLNEAKDFNYSFTDEGVIISSVK
jgi:ferric-dicitrate binding protein FerR (iron transport regulator)